MDQNRNKEGENKVNLKTSQSLNDEQSGKTFENITAEEIQNNKIKNLIATIVLLAGVVFGAIFVDVAQFLTQSGYSGRALKDAEMFSAGGKTWVAFEDPAIEVKVLSVNDDELKDCSACDPAEILYQLKKVLPTLVAKKITASSDEGKEMIEKYQLNAIPSFVFNKDVTKTSFYQQAGVSAIFEEKNENLVLNSNVLGIPAGKYLNMPEIVESDAILGNKEAEVKIIVFSDFQCPYSKMFYDVAKKTLASYENNVAFVLKDLPLSFHAQAQNAAMASRCAQEQGKFWEMADQLYANQQVWGGEEGKEIFKSYGSRIGINTTQFNQCLEDDKYLEKIKTDEALAGDFGITGTPSGFIGDQFMGGVLQEEQFKQTIDAQLAK